MQAFRPYSKKTTKVSVTDTPTLVPLEYGEGRELAVRFYNESTDIIFVSFGDEQIVANTTTSFPIPGGIVEVVALAGRNGTPRFMSVVKASGTGTLWASLGKGM